MSSARRVETPVLVPECVNLEAEEYVISAAMLAGCDVVALAEIVGADDFYRESHGVLFDAIVGLCADGLPAEPVSLIDYLAGSGRLDLVAGGASSGAERVREIASLAGAMSNAPHHAWIVAREARTRRALKKLAETQAALLNGGLHPGQAEQLLADLESTMSDRTAARAAEHHSWLPSDLIGEAFTDVVPPTVACLSYPGLSHIWTAEPEGLKSFLALAGCSVEMNAGNAVVYIDFEMSKPQVLGRLRDLGVDDETIQTLFLYITPSEPLTGRARTDLRTVLADRRPTLIVIDAFTGALTAHGLDPNSGADIEAFHLRVVDPLREHGAAVVILDHLPKDPDRRGRFAIGSERKIGRADVHLGIEVLAPLSRGTTGRAQLTTHKDRLGHLPRPICAIFEIASDGDTGRITWSLEKSTGVQSLGTRPFRPTTLMERVSRLLEGQTDPTPRGRVEKSVKGSAKGVRHAMDVLVDEGFVVEESGARNARNLRSVSPYRQGDDPTSSTSSQPRPTPPQTGSVPTSSSSSLPVGGDEVARDWMNEPSHLDLVPA